MTNIGYARTSTADQSIDLQTDALRSAGCERIFAEQVSGTRDDRPELTRALDYVRPGDTLVVWRLDRLGRSLRHLLDVVDGLGKAGVQFRSLTEGLDTTTPAGTLLFTIVGAIAEFERKIIVERTNAGLAAARARGRVGGRPSTATPEKVARARELVEERRLTMDEVARAVGTSRATLYRWLTAPSRAGRATGV